MKIVMVLVVKMIQLLNSHMFFSIESLSIRSVDCNVMLSAWGCKWTFGGTDFPFLCCTQWLECIDSIPFPSPQVMLHNNVFIFCHQNLPAFFDVLFAIRKTNKLLVAHSWFIWKISWYNLCSIHFIENLYFRFLKNCEYTDSWFVMLCSFLFVFLISRHTIKVQLQVRRKRKQSCSVPFVAWKSSNACHRKRVIQTTIHHLTIWKMHRFASSHLVIC